MSDINGANTPSAKESPSTNNASSNNNNADSAALQQRIAELEAKNMQYSDKAQRFEAFAAKYNKDDKFKKTFDLAWDGKFDEIKTAFDEKNNFEDLPEEEKLKKDLKEFKQEFKQELDSLKNQRAFEKYQSFRDSNSYAYEEAFQDIATQNGFKVGSPEYQTLFDLSEAAAKRIAGKYGLVDKNGIADPNLKFTPDFLLETFKVAKARMDESGFDLKEKQRRDWARREEEKRKIKEEKFKQEYDPKKLKTQSDRARFMQAQWQKLLKEKGISTNN